MPEINQSLEAGAADLLIVIPCYNAEQFVKRALDSVAMQRSTSRIAFVAVDDGSSDNTWEVLEEYRQAYRNAQGPSLQTIKLEKNHGKAHAVDAAMRVVDSEFVSILDADDFYSSRYVAQRHLQLLQNDASIFASAVQTLKLTPTGVDLVSRARRSQKFTYVETIRGAYYFHTSAYCYRRPWKRLPAFLLKHDELRGDTAFHAAVAMEYMLGIQFSPTIATVYDASHQGGIWSSLDAEARHTFNRKILKSLSEYAKSLDLRWESQEFLKRRINLAQNTSNSDPSLSDCLNDVKTVLRGVHQHSMRPGLWLVPHLTPEFDSFCECLGAVIWHEKRAQADTTVKPQDRPVGVLVSGLRPQGGGIFSYLMRLVDQIGAERVFILVSDPNAIDQSARRLLNDKVEVVSPPFSESAEDTVAAIQKMTSSEAIVELHYLIGHHDVALCSSLMPWTRSRKTLHFVYDHGSSLGLHLSGIDAIVTQSSMHRILIEKSLSPLPQVQLTEH